MLSTMEAYTALLSGPLGVFNGAMSASVRCVPVKFTLLNGFAPGNELFPCLYAAGAAARAAGHRARGGGADTAARRHRPAWRNATRTVATRAVEKTCGAIARMV